MLSELKPKKKRIPSPPPWGMESEKKFIDGLGTFSEAACRSTRPYIEWLRLYVETYTKSTLPVHKQGVRYAKTLIKQLVTSGDIT